MDPEWLYYEHSGPSSTRYYIRKLGLYQSQVEANSDIGLWRHPRNRSAQYTDIEYWTDMAKVLEKGKIHALFIADVLGAYDVYKGPDNLDPGLAGVAQFPNTDPL
jgi:alkanesulfonate monooxygenase SsuD/methylene tetrahydromethanopterin reductase-like flavin-dependent oxidoreductase (luciferase family)